MSFADNRNVQSAMDVSPDTSVSIKSSINDPAPQYSSPLLSPAVFDFQSHKYIAPSLLKQVFIYLRLKASATFILP